MKPEAQRIAIAEACGWSVYSKPTKKHPRTIYKDGSGSKFCTVWNTGTIGGDKFPDYLSDLNAMHEAENSLTPNNFQIYGDILTAACEADGTPVFSPTAAQRAEAFLKTIGKWEPAP